MTDPTLHPRPALEESAPGGGDGPGVGRHAPYPVWIVVTVAVRVCQILFVACLIWFLAALFDAMEKPHTVSLPPLWLFLVTGFIGTEAGDSHESYRTSALGDWIGNSLASQQCPACGQNVFDHTPPSGYAPDSQRHRYFPSRICTNCGHDLKQRTSGRPEPEFPQ